MVQLSLTKNDNGVLVPYLKDIGLSFSNANYDTCCHVIAHDLCDHLYGVQEIFTWKDEMLSIGAYTFANRFINHSKYKKNDCYLMNAFQHHLNLMLKSKYSLKNNLPFLFSIHLIEYFDLMDKYVNDNLLHLSQEELLQISLLKGLMKSYHTEGYYIAQYMYKKPENMYKRRELIAKQVSDLMKNKSDNEIVDYNPPIVYN